MQSGAMRCRQLLGVGVSTGTLGGDVRMGMIATLRGGVQGVAFGTLGGAALGRAVSGVDSFIALRKMSESFWIACSWSLLTVANGAAGEGLSKASASVRAACAATSAEDVFGMGHWWGRTGLFCNHVLPL